MDATDLLDALEERIKAVAELVGPAVVGFGGRAGGTAVVVAPGQVLTNAHNARGEEFEVRFHDGRRAAGRVIGLDVDGDLAVVATDTGDITPVTWHADAEPVSIGRVVFGLSNPAGRALRVSFGTVSGTGRSFRGPRGRVVPGGIEHTAPLPRGSSGGPLVDRAGTLVGINTNRIGDSLYIALPATAALRERVTSLGRGESRDPVRLGLALAPAHVARRLRAAVGLEARDGLLVRGVEPGSPADRAGVRSGDLLTTAGDQALAGADDLFGVLDRHDPATDLTLTVLRGADELQLTVQFRSEVADDD